MGSVLGHPKYYYAPVIGVQHYDGGIHSYVNDEILHDVNGEKKKAWQHGMPFCETREEALEALKRVDPSAGLFDEGAVIQVLIFGKIEESSTYGNAAYKMKISNSDQDPWRDCVLNGSKVFEARKMRPDEPNKWTGLVGKLVQIVAP